MKTQTNTNEIITKKDGFNFALKLETLLREQKAKEQNAQELINETETELFTDSERADLNIKKVVGK